MKLKSILQFAFIGFSAAFYYGCHKPETGGVTTPTTTFDKNAMLTQYADSIIIPGYKAMQQKMAALIDATENFAATPNATTQLAAKNTFEAAHLQYNRIALFQFGPAETALLDLYLNFSGGLDYSFTTSGELTGFSIDTAAIERNITTGSYDFTTMGRSSFYAQGFPALDYLLFAPDAITAFNANATARRKYIQDVTIRMQNLINGVATGWTTYRADFIGNTQSNSGSPMGNIVNQLAYQMDLLKGPRIGWPFGKQSNGTVFAHKTEAYYAGISAKLAKESLTGLKAMYTAGGSGKGISDYIISRNGTALNSDIIAQFDLAQSKLSEVSDPLSAALTTNAGTIDAAYKEIQKLLTLLKTDAASATAVQITFTDNDGD